MRSRTLYRIILGSAILIAILLYTNPALAGIGVQPTITELEVAPGQIKTGSFRVANGGEDPVHVKVEVEDWLKVRVGESPIDVEDWLVMEETEFELEPAEIKNIGYQILAPEGIEGELIAMVFFSSTVPGGGALSITSRFGVAVYAGIEGTEVIDAEIEDIKMDSSKSKLLIFVKNKGNVHLRPSSTLFIRDLEGSLIHEGKIPYTAVIFAGRTHTYPFKLDIDGLSSGDYEVEAIFDTGTIYDKSKKFSKKVTIYVE